jgi:hypothetical protein
MALNTYGHVFDELEGAEKQPAEELIREARATLVRSQLEGVASAAKEPVSAGRF